MYDIESCNIINKDIEIGHAWFFCMRIFIFNFFFQYFFREKKINNEEPKKAITSLPLLNFYETLMKVIDMDIHTADFFFITFAIFK